MRKEITVISQNLVFTLFKYYIYLLYIEVAPPRPPLPGSNIPPPRPPPPETDDEEEMFMHAPQPNQPIMVRKMFDYSTFLLSKNYIKYKKQKIHYEIC